MKQKLIYEDFLEINELVETETYFKNRSKPLNIDIGDFDKIYLTNYHNVTAFLIENVITSEESLSNLYRKIWNLEEFEQKIQTKKWFLGANNVDVSNINSKKKLRCGQYSCYEKSLREGKICKQGKF